MLLRPREGAAEQSEGSQLHNKGEGTRHTLSERKAGLLNLKDCMAHVCELCGREGVRLTRHHLIPKTRHSNKRNKRNFDREDVKTRIAWFCRPCHTHAHCILTEKQMEYEFNTLAALAAHPEIQKFAQWIAKKPAGFKPQARAKKQAKEAEFSTG